jgi:hypothetical protein
MVRSKRLTTLASAVPPAARDGFLQMVADKLLAYPLEARGPAWCTELQPRRNATS